MLRILNALIYFLFTGIAMAATQPINQNIVSIEQKLNQIELVYSVKVGVYAFDTNSNKIISHNAKSHFPFQSTCKFVGVSALLAKTNTKVPINREVTIKPNEIIYWHPISGKYINKQVSLKKLAMGAVAYSDNTAINLIIKELGGLDYINNFAHENGNKSFNMAHYEVNLNSNPNKAVDTSTPKDMATLLKNILLGNVLTLENRNLLLEWMKDNTTGYKRIRAGVPLGWTVADKTGSGSYAVANDIGIAWSPHCKPVVLSIYTFSGDSNAKPNDVVIKKVTEAVFEKFAQYDGCYAGTDLATS